jgi:hypothetical protein
VRCFFVKGGHIVAAEEFTGLSEDEVHARSRSLFADHPMKPERYEVWDRDRMAAVFPAAEKTTASAEELSLS